jgi:FkbM family methyltransferase
MNSHALLGDQLRLVPAASTIVDVGAQHGTTTRQYLDAYPQARIFAFEADLANHRRAAGELASYGARVSLARAAVADRAGSASFHVNSHDGTHSLLPIGEQRYWNGPAHNVRRETVETVTLDSFAVTQALNAIDILKMDIQGAELRALRGAESLLAQGKIRLIAIEVCFQPLYRDQPLIWQIGAYLHAFGYGLYRIYDSQYHVKNERVLSWADAIFLAPEFLHVPEWDAATEDK